MRRTLIAATAAIMVLPFIFGSGSGQAARRDVFRLTNRVAPSGVVTSDPFAKGKLPKGVKPHKAAPIPGPGSNGCVDGTGANIRVNQECTNQSAAGYLGRSSSQNETAAAVNPTNPLNVIASQNDYRLGDARCGTDWSLDGGATWGSGLAPTGFALPILDNGGVRHYWTTGGDTSVAFDSTGEAYLMCQVFDRGFPTDERGSSTIFGVDASGFLLFRSADGGASWSFTGSYVATTPFGEGGETDIGLLDKEYMTIDNNPDSPFADRIYVAWAQYDSGATKSPSYLAYSDDFGNSWSTPAEISGKSETLCPITFSDATDFSCDESQFNQPFVGPDGAVYDVFVNSNNCAGALREIGFDCPGADGDNHNQVLLVKSTDGGVTWSDPVKVADYNELPDCFTYTGQDFGRACIPTAPLTDISIFRATNYPVGVAVSATDIEVTLGSYINAHSNRKLGNCVPDGISTDTFLNLYQGVGDVGGCNNDILLSSSSDGGATFSGGHVKTEKLPVVSTEASDGPFADQWWQWSALGPDSSLVTAYYDRMYGSDMANGFMDISLHVLGSATAVRVTDLSMPPGNDFPASNGYSTFFGDYNALAIGSDGVAHAVWMDTRNPIYTFNSAPGADPRTLTFAGYGADIYTAAIPQESYLSTG